MKVKEESGKKEMLKEKVKEFQTYTAELEAKIKSLENPQE